MKGGCLEKRGSNPLHTMLLRDGKGGPWFPDLLGGPNLKKIISIFLSLFIIILTLLSSK